MIQIVLVRDKKGYWVKTFNGKECTESTVFTRMNGMLMYLRIILPLLKKSKGL